jgi:hypothetical protein
MSTPLGGLPQLPFWNRGNEYRFAPQWAGWLSTAQNILTAASTAGTTAQRPTMNQFQGMPYFDTTLGKPIWLKTPGAVPVWVDATGAPA